MVWKIIDRHIEREREKKNIYSQREREIETDRININDRNWTHREKIDILREK